ncbi:Transient receptor potential-gamma protein [Schistosoma japonicum]|uniref:Transient receptor potential-gamma protein n=1 Tax=Schistosoma japonicum TaxID=6182 RepID=A0A4Z2DCP6_SCHJA|nr:Transient receptor potential-gamma protein [Schistosoma japonicum]
MIDLSSIELPITVGDLNDIERLFLYAAEQGDLATIKQLTDQANELKLNLNCTDTLGRDVLRIAIENEHMELLQFLVALPNLDLKDCILHAINEDNVIAVEIILHAQNERDVKKDLQGLLGRFQSSSFTPDINGIILAAHRDNYVILKLLLDRGERIYKPHDLRCACNICTQARRENGLQHSKLRINTYRALTSPSFIILTSNDPILTAFELSWELKKLGELENEFRTDYAELEAKCQKFATDMLAQTRSSVELSIILNHDTGADVSNCHFSGPNHQPSFSEDISERMQLSRLKLAIRYEQKQFVAHPHCQQLLATIWYEGLPGFRQKPVFAQLTTIGVLCSLFPLMATFYMLAPNSKMGSMMKKPFIKFLCHSSSYLSFLALLTLAATRVEFLLTNSLDQRMHDRGPTPSLTESALVIYVIGFVWQQMKKLYTCGLRAYLMDMWNLVDFVMNALYVATISLRTVAWARIVFYDEPRYINRGQWDSFDPVLVSECLFAAANIVSTLKLVYVFTVSPQLGPLQISLGRMLYDIFRFFCVYFLVLVAFAFGFNQLYWFYAKNRARNCKNVHFTLEEGQKDVYDYCITRGTYFTNLFEIVQSLYWSAYGLIDLTSFNLEYPHVFTEFVGKLTFGTYSYIAFIVLLNMLIAMMNSSYEQIVGQVDVEWKFARSKLWISFFGEGCTVPVPFNIIPTPKAFMYMLTSFQELFSNCYKKKLHRNDWEAVRLRIKQVKECEARYQSVMRELTKRYIMQKLRSSENDTVSADDLSEIKGDISAFRHELLDILKSNGMKIPAYHKTVSKLRRGREVYQLSEIQEVVRGKKTKDSIKRTTINIDQDKTKQPKPLLNDMKHSVPRKLTIPDRMNKANSTKVSSSNSSTSGTSITGPVDNPAFENEEVLVNKTSRISPVDLNKTNEVKSIPVADQAGQSLYPTVVPCTSTVVCEEMLSNSNDQKSCMPSNQFTSKQPESQKEHYQQQLQPPSVSSSPSFESTVNEPKSSVQDKSQLKQDISDNKISAYYEEHVKPLSDKKSSNQHCKLNASIHQPQQHTDDDDDDDCSKLKYQRSDFV